MALVTYAQAKAHLRLTDDEAKADVLVKIIQASALVLNRLERSAADSPAWDEDTDPEEDNDFALAQAATLITLADLWRFRGDDDEGGFVTEPWYVNGRLPPKAERILFRLRGPSLA